MSVRLQTFISQPWATAGIEETVFNTTSYRECSLSTEVASHSLSGHQRATVKSRTEKVIQVINLQYMLLPRATVEGRTNKVRETGI